MIIRCSAELTFERERGSTGDENLRTLRMSSRGKVEKGSFLPAFLEREPLGRKRRMTGVSDQRE